MDDPPEVKRGFAAMTPERRREISSKGGVSVRPEDRAFSKDKDLAVAAGRKGGAADRDARPAKNGGSDSV